MTVTEPYEYIVGGAEDGEETSMHAAARLLDYGEEGDEEEYYRQNWHLGDSGWWRMEGRRRGGMPGARRMRQCIDAACSLKGALVCAMGLTFACVAFFILWAAVMTSFPSSSSSGKVVAEAVASSTSAEEFYYPGTFDSERVEEAITRLVDHFILNATGNESAWEDP